MSEKRDWRKYYNPEVQKKASAKYDATHVTRISIKLNNTHDADILAYLDAMPNKQGYIKRLIREDMVKGEK